MSIRLQAHYRIVLDAMDNGAAELMEQVISFIAHRAMEEGIELNKPIIVAEDDNDSLQLCSVLPRLNYLPEDVDLQSQLSTRVIQYQAYFYEGGGNK